MKNVAAAVLVPLSLSASLGVSAASLSECGLDVARTRNVTELTCYIENGPKSDVWSVANQGPLDACLAGVNGIYDAGLHECNALYAPPRVVDPIDPRKATVGGAGILSIIFLLISP